MGGCADSTVGRTFVFHHYNRAKPMRVGRQILYASSIGAIGLAAKSVLDRPVPMPVVAVASGVLGAVVLAGVFEPRLAMYADVVVRGKEKPEAPRVALTFDDGPSAKSTPKVLDALDAAGAKGTFFVVGRKLDGEAKSIARDALSRGHAIGCHSFAHDRLFALRGEKRVRDDLLRALSTIEDATGEGTRLFRPPIGHTNPIIARVVEELGLTIVGFSVRALDGMKSAHVDRVARRVESGLRDGAIVLLHDAAEREDFDPAGPRALPRILEAMRAKRLGAVTVPQLLAVT